MELLKVVSRRASRFFFIEAFLESMAAWHRIVVLYSPSMLDGFFSFFLRIFSAG